MRRVLDGVYDAAGYLAALFLIATLALVVLGIAGRQLNFYIPGHDNIAGYCMAGAGFLALAYTLKKGEHIRVELLLQRLKGSGKKGIEIWALGVATAVAGMLAFYAVRLCVNSHRFEEKSTNLDATPLWLPQITLAFGTILLFVVLADELILELRGKRVARKADEPLHNE
jgi:TRAP-type C4-dicarboxylate transport system permease small subunit